MGRMIFDVYQGERPTEGLYLVGERRRHVVLRVRPIDSRLWHDRWELEVRRMVADEVIPPGARVWETSTYGPGFCPACIAGEAGLAVPDYVVHRCGAG